MPDRTSLGALGILAFALLCFQLQLPISSIAPVLDVIQTDLALSAGVAGIVTSIPVLCFALLTPAASALLARVGIERAVALCFVGVIAGALIRSGGALVGAGTVGLFAGTIVLGCAITIANVAVPTLIARDYRHRAVIMTGVQTAAANLGAAFASALIVPTALLLGWNGGLLLWSSLAVAALLVWVVAYPASLREPVTARRLRRRMQATVTDTVNATMRATLRSRARRLPRPAELEFRVEAVVTASIPVVSSTPRDRALIRRPLAWLLAACFSGHALCYFALVSWLPQFLTQERGLSATDAALASSLFLAFAIAGPLLVPALGTWFRWGLTPLMVLVTSCWMLCPLGLLLAPELFPLWIVFGGLAQGGTYTVISIVVIERTRDAHDSRRLLTFVLTIGYAVAATGPVLLGVLRDSTGGWVVPFLVVAAVTASVAATGIAATRVPRPAEVTA